MFVDAQRQVNHWVDLAIDTRARTTTPTMSGTLEMSSEPLDDYAVLGSVERLAGPSTNTILPSTMSTVFLMKMMLQAVSSLSQDSIIYSDISTIWVY